MSLQLRKSIVVAERSLRISGSKSETNRLLLLQALYPTITLENGSNSDDSEVMIKALKSSDSIIDVHHAGTAMRFLTAYFAIQEGRTVILTGSDRMKERPIKILVDALRSLGAHIEYLENEGFPPLKIVGKTLSKNRVSLNPAVSSQYISALLLIAPKLNNGLEIKLDGQITSLPYIKMTLALLDEIGVESSFIENTITIKSLATHTSHLLNVESDWSSVSYFYSIVALSEVGTKVTLYSFRQNSYQGDANLVAIYQQFGVETVFSNDTITLRKAPNNLQKNTVKLDLSNTPDLAQTIAVTCFGLGIACELSGLHTLKIKETDRLVALQTELQKLGAEVSITNDSLSLLASSTINTEVEIATYNDHRMAMAFAPLALKVSLKIENPDVVSKSYPDFWKDLAELGFEMDRSIKV